MYHKILKSLISQMLQLLFPFAPNLILTSSNNNTGNNYNFGNAAREVNITDGINKKDIMGDNNTRNKKKP